MKSIKIFIAFIFLLAFAVCTSAQNIKSRSLKLSTSDKTEILNQVFADGFEKLIGSSQFSQCLTPIIEDKKVIFLMTDFDKDLNPKIGEEYRFVIMSYSHIDEQVKKNSGECYFKLNDFQIINSKVVVSLSRIIEEIYSFKDSLKSTSWISGEGYFYEFDKAKKWRMLSSKKTIISS